MEYNQKMLEAKRRLLERFKREGKTTPAARDRLPPGQHLTQSFPVLDLGVRPSFHPARWRFQVEGEVENPIDVDWEGFLQLAPKSEQVADFHCVTTWSKFDVRWGGIKFLDLASLVRPAEQARFLIAHSADGYTTNLPLADCMAEDVILAWELDGQPLPLEHGGPMRLVVPELYGWKSAKFLRKLVFSAQDQPGFWEVRGYHNRGNPWAEERYG